MGRGAQQSFNFQPYSVQPADGGQVWQVRLLKILWFYHFRCLRCFMLFSLLFVPLSHLSIPEFALLQFFIPSFNQKRCQQLDLLLLVNSKYYLKNKYLTTILCWHGYFWTFKNKVEPAYKKQGLASCSLTGNFNLFWIFKGCSLDLEELGLQPECEEGWDAQNAASLLCPYLKSECFRSDTALHIGDGWLTLCVFCVPQVCDSL